MKAVKIELKKIIKVYGLDEKELACQLFKKNRYPKQALNRVKRGVTELDAAQLQRLSEITGVRVDLLYTDKGWSMEGGGHEVLFRRGEYTARLDLDHWRLTIAAGGCSEHTASLVSPAISVRDLIGYIDTTVTTVAAKG